MRTRKLSLPLRRRVTSASTAIRSWMRSDRGGLAGSVTRRDYSASVVQPRGVRSVSDLSNFRRGLEHGAGDAGAAVSARVAHIIVGAGVKHERGTVGIEQARHARAGKRHRRFQHTIRFHFHVAHVAGVRTGGIVEPVLAAEGVPVRAGTREIWRVAAADAVHVDSVEAMRKAGRVDLERDSAARLPSAYGADALGRGADQRDRCPAFGLAIRNARGECNGGDQKYKLTHLA